MNTIEEKASRHARKEQNLRLAFKGNVLARVELLKKILSGYATKQSFDDFVLDIERLFTFPENYIGCEKQFNILLKIIELSDELSLSNSAEKFKSELKRMNLHTSANRFKKNS